MVRFRVLYFPRTGLPGADSNSIYYIIQHVPRVLFAETPGNPAGKSIKVGGLDCYYAKSISPSDKGTLIFTDVFGLSVSNVKLVADRFALQGYPTFVPDLPDTSNYWPWAERNPISRVLEEAERIIEEIRSKYGVKRLAGHGYCYGGKSTLILNIAGKLDAIAVAHPSLLTENNLKAVPGPVLYLCAEVDEMFTEDLRAFAEEEMKTRKVPSRFVLYPGTVHGFTLRYDSDDQEAVKQALDAQEQAIKFFNEYL
ncbi:uncharacterized protein VTP21DRAFT_1829 [Calcarisporiella thermophila]|uniref:uncharacterized protein n=1 Tax=Calcarisporiella thermophila TaxID=911321 RepID=UPI0037431FD5